MASWHKYQMTTWTQPKAFVHSPTMFLTTCLLSTGRAWRGWTCWSCWIRWTPCTLATSHPAIQYTIGKSYLCSRTYTVNIQIHTHTHLPSYWPSPVPLPPLRAPMVNPEQEESVDLLELREKLAPLALLDPLDSLDPLLVPLTLDTHRILAFQHGRTNLTRISLICQTQQRVNATSDRH